MVVPSDNNLYACTGGERSGFYYIIKVWSDKIGDGVEDRESDVRVDVIIRANETEETEKGRRIYKGVKVSKKLGALGVKEIGVWGYGMDKSELVVRILEYLSRGVNLKSVIYGEGSKEDRVNKERVIYRDTLFVKLKYDVSYTHIMKTLRKEVNVKEVEVRVTDVRNIRNKEIAIRPTERKKGVYVRMREKMEKCLETEDIRTASERTGTILRVLDVDETVGKEEIESAIEEIAGNEAREKETI
ncbi:hypothetical protein FQA39_LY04892 [Lamprigera yunnana]|nr:hypothetical protein FQA39_LY04892 [Lamprigera yunnana]